jgi:hypothetical protein
MKLLCCDIPIAGNKPRDPHEECTLDSEAFIESYIAEVGF